MIEIHIDPTLASLGPFQITWHGLFSLVAIVAGVALGASEFRRKGLSEAIVFDLAIWALPAGIIGARLAHVVDHWAYYLAHPATILAVNEGGLSIYGGLIGGLVGAGVCIKLRSLPFWAIVDAAAPAMLLGQAIGRLGCLVNGDAWGSPADLPWAVVYTHPQAALPSSLLGVATHPYPVYEMVWVLLMLAGLWRLRGRLPEGSLFCLYAIGYSAGRLSLSVFRQETAVLGDLQQAQVIALLVIVVAVPFLMHRIVKGRGQYRSQSGLSGGS